jgi:hypothetical protein
LEQRVCDGQALFLLDINDEPHITDFGLARLSQLGTEINDFQRVG